MTFSRPLARASLLALCAAALSAHGATMTEAQARSYFAAATTTATGSLDGEQEIAALMPNPGKDTARVEIWRKAAGGSFELVASAPKAGCSDCSGPTRKSNPTRLIIDKGSLHVEYQGGGEGLGFWAWRSSWSWDPVMGRLRALSTQRIGADEEGDTRHTLVNFVEGSRSQRLKRQDAVKATSCRAAITRQPAFSDLSLPALFDGTLEPNCQAGTDVGDSLASAPAPGSGALDNLMRASAPKPIKPMPASASSQPIPATAP